MEQQKIPPQVPPKPRSSRVDENDHIEAELKHIMNGHQQRNNTTPPLPALSPGPGMLGMLLNPGLDSNADSSSPDTRPSRPSRLGKNIFSIETSVFFLVWSHVGRNRGLGAFRNYVDKILSIIYNLPTLKEIEIIH